MASPEAAARSAAEGPGEDTGAAEPLRLEGDSLCVDQEADRSADQPEVQRTKQQRTWWCARCGTQRSGALRSCAPVRVSGRVMAWVSRSVWLRQACRSPPNGRQGAIAPPAHPWVRRDEKNALRRSATPSVPAPSPASWD